MGPGVKKDPVCSQSTGYICKTVLIVGVFAGRQGVGKLILVKIHQGRGTGTFGKGLEIRQAHQVGGDQTMVAFQRGNIFYKIKGGTPHAPLPEAGRQRQQIDPVTGVGNQAPGEFTMGSAKKGFQK